MTLRFALMMLAVTCGIFAQTATPDLTPAPAAALPAGIIVTGNFNQLGTPRFTGGFGAIYPLSTTAKLYGVTGGEFYPMPAIDPATKRSFYALDVHAVQEIHRDMLDAGRFSFFLGGGGGPAISSTSTSWTASLSTDVAGTVIVRLRRSLSMVLSVKGQYTSGVGGWNLIPRAGLKIDLPRKSR